MTFWIKLAIIAGILSTVFGAGFHTARNIDRVADLKAQADDLREAQRVSAVIADQRATRVQELADLNQQSEEDLDALRTKLRSRHDAGAGSLSDPDRVRLQGIRPRPLKGR
jgi:outer membrane murein-binding lipoprotein Lpp